MSALLSGSQVTFSVTAQTDGFSSPSATFAEVSAFLQSQGIAVFNPQVTQGALAVIGAAGYDASYQVTFVAEAPSDYADENDFIAIVTNAFYQVTGVLPSSLAATGTLPPGALPPAASPSAVGGGSSITDAISNAFKGITSTTTTILVAIAAIIILVLVLIAYGPNVKHVAGALA